MDGGQHFQRRRGKLDKGGAFVVDVYGRIRQLLQVVDRVRAYGRGCGGRLTEESFADAAAGARSRSRAWRRAGARTRARGGAGRFRRVGRRAGKILSRGVGHLSEDQIVVEAFDRRRRGVDVRVGAPDVGVAVIRMVAGKAEAFRTIRAVHTVQHAVVERREQRPGGGRHRALRILHKLAHVHHVEIALLAGVAAVVFRVLRAARKLGEKLARVLRGGLQRLDAVCAVSGEQRRRFRYVGDGQGRNLVHVVFLAAGEIGVANSFAESRAAHGGIFCQRVDPAGVVPAAARLAFLRGDHVAGEAVDRAEGVDGGHQAGVKADQFEGRIFGVRAVDRGKGVAHFVEAHHVLAALVEADAADAAAAVVPEDEDFVVGGVIIFAEAQEVLQPRACTHVHVGNAAEVVKAFRVVHEASRAASRHAVRVPLFCAAGLDHDLDVGRQLDLLQFLEVEGGRAVFRFEVGAAEVPVHNPGVG